MIITFEDLHKKYIGDDKPANQITENASYAVRRIILSEIVNVFSKHKQINIQNVRTKG